MSVRSSEGTAPALSREQQLSRGGLYCAHYGASGCRKFLASQWAYAQHLRCKHNMARDCAQKFSASQLDQLQRHRGREDSTRQTDKGDLRDHRRLAEPSAPPTRKQRDYWAARSRSQAPLKLTEAPHHEARLKLFEHRVPNPPPLQLV